MMIMAHDRKGIQDPLEKKMQHPTLKKKQRALRELKRSTKGKASSLLLKAFQRMEKFNVLVIGDTIIDEYVYVTPKGRATKDPMLSTAFVRKETMAGGVLAVCNHIANFTRKVELISVVGDKENYLPFIRKATHPRVRLQFFIRKHAPTIVKRRFIDHYRQQKLFKIEEIDDSPIDSQLEKRLIAAIKKAAAKADLVLVSDFGHGLISERILLAIEEHAPWLAINAQTNSSNIGFNLITRYDKGDFVSIDEHEMRLAIGDRYCTAQRLINKFRKKTGFRNFLLTLGKRGCVYAEDKAVSYFPVITNKVVDSIGAGDSVFAITSLAKRTGLSADLIPYLANCVGSFAVQIVGNKDSVKKKELLKFMKETLNEHRR